MSDLLDKLAAKQASKQEAAEERERQVAEAIIQRQDYDAAWEPVIAACRFGRPNGEAARDFLALGRLLRKRCYDAYLPSIIAHREAAEQRGDPWAEGELCILELLRQAVAPKVSKAAMAKAFRQVATLRAGYASASISEEARNVAAMFDTWHENGGRLPKAGKPIAPAARIALTQEEKTILDKLPAAARSH